MSEVTENSEAAENPNAESAVVAPTEAPKEAPKEAPGEAPGEAAEEKDEISYHAVEKNGTITAIWEMRGRRHVRTIDPRSVEGRHLLGTPESSEAAAG